MIFIISLIIISLSACLVSYYVFFDEIVKEQKKEARKRFNKQNKKGNK